MKKKEKKDKKRKEAVQVRQREIVSSILTWSISFFLFFLFFSFNAYIVLQDLQYRFYKTVATASETNFAPGLTPQDAKFNK